MTRSNAFLAVAVLACLFVAPAVIERQSLLGGLRDTVSGATGGLVDAEVQRTEGTLDAAAALGPADVAASVGTFSGGKNGLRVAAGVGDTGLDGFAGTNQDGRPTVQVQGAERADRLAADILGK
ncbi:hypothetical protein OEZ86_010502 [Tetradesmus obliquus]|nr:hypothetical protein OEZ86_010502 [Tetradesmus obliquus]